MVAAKLGIEVSIIRSLVLARSISELLSPCRLWVREKQRRSAKSTNPVIDVRSWGKPKSPNRESPHRNEKSQALAEDSRQWLQQPGNSPSAGGRC